MNLIYIFTLALALLGLSLNETYTLSNIEGFGAASVGGEGGKVLVVTTLEDDAKNPPVGSLRWAVNQKGSRIVKFAVVGTIILKDHLKIREPYLTIDGSDAPGQGVCLRDYSVEIEDTHDIIVRYIRIRRGDVKVLEENKRLGRDRPDGSTGLACFKMIEIVRFIHKPLIVISLISF